MLIRSLLLALLSLSISISFVHAASLAAGSSSQIDQAEQSINQPNNPLAPAQSSYSNDANDDLDRPLAGDSSNSSSTALSNAAATTNSSSSTRWNISSFTSSLSSSPNRSSSSSSSTTSPSWTSSSSNQLIPSVTSITDCAGEPYISACRAGDELVIGGSNLNGSVRVWLSGNSVNVQYECYVTRGRDNSIVFALPVIADAHLSMSFMVTVFVLNTEIRVKSIGYLNPVFPQITSFSGCLLQGVIAQCATDRSIVIYGSHFVHDAGYQAFVKLGKQRQYTCRDVRVGQTYLTCTLPSVILDADYGIPLPLFMESYFFAISLGWYSLHYGVALRSAGNSTSSTGPSVSSSSSASPMSSSSSSYQYIIVNSIDGCESGLQGCAADMMLRWNVTNLPMSSDISATFAHYSCSGITFTSPGIFRCQLPAIPDYDLGKPLRLSLLVPSIGVITTEYSVTYAAPTIYGARGCMNGTSGCLLGDFITLHGMFVPRIIDVFVGTYRGSVILSNSTVIQFRLIALDPQDSYIFLNITLMMSSGSAIVSPVGLICISQAAPAVTFITGCDYTTGCQPNDTLRLQGYNLWNHLNPANVMIGDYDCRVVEFSSLLIGCLLSIIRSVDVGQQLSVSFDVGDGIWRTSSQFIVYGPFVISSTASTSTGQNSLSSSTFSSSGTAENTSSDASTSLFMSLGIVIGLVVAGLLVACIFCIVWYVRRMKSQTHHGMSYDTYVALFSVGEGTTRR